MGKKYIIELESGTHIFVLGPEGIVHIGEPDVVYETVDGMQIGDAVINAKPYTEPDLEQVRKEAYQKGYETGYEDGYNEPGKNKQEAYQRGLNDAWEAASEIAVIPYDEMEKIFGATGWHIFMKCTASEVIEKIRQYGQEKEELGIQGYFKKGEEVIDADGTKAVVLNVSEDNYCQVYTENGCIYNWHIYTYKFHKTGRHFHEIAAVLEKMRGENND